MTRTATRLAAGIVAAFAAAALAACASTGTSGLGTTGPSGSAPAPVETVTATATATVTATATTTAASVPCDVGNTKLTLGDGQGAAGTLVQRFIITNTGPAPCTVKGRPFISPYGPQKQGGSTVVANLDVNVLPIPLGFGNLGAPATLITLQTGDTAVFFFRWSHVPVNDQVCTVASGFDFRTPNATSTDHQVLFDFDYTPCGDVLYVSNVLPPNVE